MSNYLVAITSLIGVDDDNVFKVYQDDLSIENYEGGCKIEYFAVELKNNTFYLVETDGYVLKHRYLADGALINTEFEHVGTYGVMPIVVDADGNLWTIDYLTYDKIRKWAPDLSSRTDYNFPGAMTHQTTYFIALTHSCQYLYILELDTIAYTDTYVAKIDLSDFSLVWEESVHIGDFFGNTILVDENDDVYVYGDYAASSGIVKLSGVDGSILWGADGGTGDDYGYAHQGAYHNSRIYGGYDDGDGHYCQLNSSTGALINLSAHTAEQPNILAMLDSTSIVGGAGSATDNDFYVFDTADDFGAGEAWIAAKNPGASVGTYPFRGDATGFLNSQLYAMLGNNFAVEYTNKYYFCQEKITGTYYLRRRSLLNCNLQASEALSAQHKILCVDADGYLWTIENTPNKYIYRWNRNLLQKVTFTLKAGNALADLINYAALTYDNVCIYLTGGADNDIVSKYTLAKLDGDDPEWSVDIGSDNAGFCCMDEDDNLYVGDIPAAGVNAEIRRLAAADGSVDWGPVDGAQAGGFFAYCEENAHLYTPYDTNKYRKIDASDGSTIATTAAVATNTYCCAIAADGDHVFGGTDSAADGALRSYALDLSYEDNYQVDADKSYKFSGDPTGYLFKKFLDNKP
jgi:hypothetical protein